MKLFLCSEFITEETRPDFERLIGKKINGLKIACLITAALGYKEIMEKQGLEWNIDWLRNDIAQARSAYQWDVKEVDINTMDRNDFARLFETFDGIWVEGGMTGYLLNAINKAGFRETLLRFAREKFYIGTSAGSMICAKSQDASEWYIDEPEPGTAKLEGLRLIPFQIYPHFNPEQLELIKAARNPREEYWLIRNGQAIAVDEQGARMCGGEITILIPNQ